MSCEDCRKREFGDLEDDLGYLESTVRNHAIILVFTVAAVIVIAARLSAKGILSWPELPADG